ncbi:MAG: hypothetical protein AB7T06_43655, partial [Kofleriaceae bacterium]
MTAPALIRSAPDDLYALLVEQMRPRLLKALEAAGPGQRLRVTTLPEAVMDGICESLEGDARWVARVLAAGPDPRAWKATATKLIELRNVLENPLVVFIPPGLRTAAEDSLDIATFTELSLSTVGHDVAAVLLQRLPQPLRDEVAGALVYLREQRHVRSTDEEVDFLLTVIKNSSTAEAAGGALYVFGLIPDFAAFTRGNTLYWLSKNAKACEQLSDGLLQTSVLRLPIKQGSVQSSLYNFLRVRQRGDVRAWAAEIATKQEYRALSFDRWDFIDTSAVEELRLLVEPLTLPRQTEDAVVGTAQLPVLNLEGKDVLKVAFRSIPPPSQVTAWKSWRVQIMSVREGAPTVAWESNNFAKPAKNAKVSRSIKPADLQSLEEGTYFLKVDAYDGDGALLTKPLRVDGADPNSRVENESERFLVVRGKEVDLVPEEVRSTYASSLLDAWVRVATRALGAKKRSVVPERAAVRGEWDEPMGAPLKSDVHFELKGDDFTGFSIAMPSLLRRIERDVLQHPDTIGVYSISFLDVRSLADVEFKVKEPLSLGTGPDVDAFLNARRAVFKAIFQHHFLQEDLKDAPHRAGLVETVDLAPFAEHIERYATAYVTLAEAARTSTRSEEMSARVRALAHLDMIELRWRASVGDPGRAVVVVPTHPLRLLWHLRHTQTCTQAIKAWEDGTRNAPDWRRLMDQLREDLLPMNLPMVIFDRRGRGYVEHSPLTHFWPLYLPDRGEGNSMLDAVATRDRLIQHMGVYERAIAVSTVDTWEVASRLHEYLTQHPYVEQLRLNVFNPGDGSLIADVLRHMEELRLFDANGQSRENPASLRYAVQLFAAGDAIDATGYGLESLLDPEQQVGEDDEFTLSTSNHLLPKLVFARNAVSDFLQSPERFPAHVSILLEQFMVQSRVGRLDGLTRGSYVGGLVQEAETRVEMQVGAHFGWVKGLRPQARRAAAPQEALLNATVAASQQLQASFATGQAVEEGVAPVVALQLDPAAQSLLKQVHEVSDWVLTLDRNLGLDYFDSPSSSREAGYLLDFAPEYLQEDRQRILLTTRSHVELENLVRPIMNRYGLSMERGDEVLVLETLRSLSGRLALRLEAGTTQSAEVVGLLLARWLLDRAGLLAQRIIIPLDAHRGWFENDEGSNKRADLLLVGFNEPNTLRFDIVEVKLREELNATTRSDLYAYMRKQTENTADRLRTLFAHDLYPQPRADELLRAKELASALSFYVRRAARYELLSDDEAARAFRVIDQLDDGYHLDIRSLGVVYEHKGKGFHVDEEEPGFPIHRFGGDKASQLLAFAAGRLTERNARLSQRTRGTSPPMELTSRDALASQLKDQELDPIRSVLEVRRPPYSERIPRKTGELSAREPGADWAGPSDTIRDPAPATPAAPAPKLAQAPISGPAQTPLPPPTQSVDPAQVKSAMAGPQAPAPEPRPLPAPTVPIADVLLGSNEMTPQYGVLGKSGSQKVAIDLNGCNTISLFGVQGFGKSYTLGVIAEMASRANARANVLPSPLATVFFHYHKSDAY